MPLGRKAGLGPGHSVRCGPPPAKGANVQPMFIVAKRIPISATAQHLLHTSRQSVPITLQWSASFPSKFASFHEVILGHKESSTKQHLDGSAIFAGLTTVTNQQTMLLNL